MGKKMNRTSNTKLIGCSCFYTCCIIIVCSFYSGIIDDVLISLNLKQRKMTDLKMTNWYYALHCDKYFNQSVLNSSSARSDNNITIPMTNWYKRQRVKCVMQYLQHEIFPYVRIEKKSFIESNSDMFVDNFNCGYSTLISHQCPILKSIYLCPGLQDRLFENYTITLLNKNKNKHKNKHKNKIFKHNKNHINFTNTFFDKYFSGNLEEKFLKRLFENGTFFNDYNGKKKTILIIGTSHLRQIFESISCMLIQFNFTNIKLWQNLDDNDLVNYYHKLNYNNNKNKWQVDIQTQSINFSKVIQDEKFLQLYLQSNYSNIDLTNYDAYKYDYHYDTPENKFDIFNGDARTNCDFVSFNNETGPCIGYDGYYANKMHIRNLNNTLKHFIYENTNWDKMYDNQTLNDILDNNIYCMDSKSILSFTNDKLNIFYYAVTGGRLELFQKFQRSMCKRKTYRNMLSHYGYNNCTHFLQNIDIIIANQGRSNYVPLYDMSFDLFDDRDKLYRLLYPKNLDNYNTSDINTNTTKNNTTDTIPVSTASAYGINIRNTNSMDSASNTGNISNTSNIGNIGNISSINNTSGRMNNHRHRNDKSNSRHARKEMKRNRKFLPIIATSNWHDPTESKDSKKIKYYSDISNIDIIDTTAYLNLDSTSQRLYRKTKELTKFQIHNHYCVPGPVTRYVWLFFEMIDLIFDAMQ